jgi:colanic acid/amylovoran biosynthesis protein
MNILVINLHSSLNAGDDVLTRVSLNLLQHNFPRSKITLAMNDPHSYAGSGVTIGSFKTWVLADSIYKKLIGYFALFASLFAALLYRFSGRKTFYLIPIQFRPLLEAYFEADIVVSSAGNFLFSGGRLGIAFLMSVGAMAYAVLLDKPLYSMPQTFGPLRFAWERWLLGWIARRMRLVFVRDPISKKLLTSVNGWHSGCKLVPDVAFLFPGGEQSEGERLLNSAVSKLDNPKLGVTLINWQAQNLQFKGQAKYETAVAEAIRVFIEQTNGQVFLFSQVRGPSWAEDDRVPARRVHVLLVDLHDRVVLIEEEQVTADSLKAAYGLMDIFIGTRLHSNIFALSAGTPAVMIQYQYKTRGIVEMLGLEKWVIEIEAITASNLSETLMSLWEQRHVVTHEINLAITKTTKQIEEIGVLIAADFKSLP